MSRHSSFGRGLQGIWTVELIALVMLLLMTARARDVIAGPTASPLSGDTPIVVSLLSDVTFPVPAGYDAWVGAGASIAVPDVLTVTSVTPSAPSVPAGTAVTWTATAAGGTGPYLVQVPPVRRCAVDHRP